MKLMCDRQAFPMSRKQFCNYRLDRRYKTVNDVPTVGCEQEFGIETVNSSV